MNFGNGYSKILIIAYLVIWVIFTRSLTKERGLDSLEKLGEIV
jgi:hypothetical protein